MSGVRLSIFTWSVYALALGLAWVAISESFADLLGMEMPPEAWARMFGIAALATGVVYLGAAIHRARWWYWYSVPVRIASGVALAAVAVTEDVWQLWVFAAIEILGAGWTFGALRWKPAPEPLEPSATS